MEITKTTRGQITVLSVQGQLDAITAPQLERELQTLSESGTDHFIVDLGGVQLISSAALRVLLSAAKFTKKQQGQILLCALTPEVRKVFELSGLTNLFNLQPTLDDALKSLGVPENPAPEPPPVPVSEPPAAVPPPVLKVDPAPEPTPPAQAPLISTDDEASSDATMEDVSPKAAAAALLGTAPPPPVEEAAPAPVIPVVVPAVPPVSAVPPPPRLVFEPPSAEPSPVAGPDPDATMLPVPVAPPASAPPAPVAEPTPPTPPMPAPVVPVAPPPAPPLAPVVAATPTPPPPPAPVSAPPPAVTPPPPVPAPVAAAAARPATPPPPVPAPIAASAPPPRAATPPPPVPAPVASARSVTPPPPVAATKPPPPPQPVAATAPRRTSPSSKSPNLTIIIAGASAVFLALCLVAALMMRHSNEPKTARQIVESPAPTIEPPGPTVEPPGPTVALNDTGASAPPAPDSVQAPAAVNLNADDASSQETRQDVLKRIDAMPLAQNKKDQLYKSVETAHHMSRVITLGFDTGRADLSAAAVANLKKAVARPDIQAVVNDPSVVVVILGFADSKGAAAKNKEISEHRAERTMKALRESCGLENVMHEIGMGGSEFLAKGNAEKNRVAEVWVVKP